MNENAKRGSDSLLLLMNENRKKTGTTTEDIMMTVSPGCRYLPEITPIQSEIKIGRNGISLFSTRFYKETE
ncbi:MAG: hypothetical protein U0T33_02545 [Bacteroidales bacterium]